MSVFAVEEENRVLQRVLAQKEAEIDRLRKQVEYFEKLTQDERGRVAQQSLDDMKNSYEAQLRQLRLDHEVTVRDIKRAYEKETQRLERNAAVALDRMYSGRSTEEFVHRNQVEELRERFNAQAKALEEALDREQRRADEAREAYHRLAMESSGRIKQLEHEVRVARRLADTDETMAALGIDRSERGTTGRKDRLLGSSSGGGSGGMSGLGTPTSKQAQPSSSSSSDEDEAAAHSRFFNDKLLEFRTRERELVEQIASTKRTYEKEMADVLEKMLVLVDEKHALQESLKHSNSQLLRAQADVDRLRNEVDRYSTELEVKIRECNRLEDLSRQLEFDNKDVSERLRTIELRHADACSEGERLRHLLRAASAHTQEILHENEVLARHSNIGRPLSASAPSPARSSFETSLRGTRPLPQSSIATDGSLMSTLAGSGSGPGSLSFSAFGGASAAAASKRVSFLL